MKCVLVDLNGYLVEDTLSTAPDCSQFMVMSPTEYDSMTYWANLAQELEPGAGVFWPLFTAMLVAYASVAALRMIVRNLMTENKRV